MSFIKKITFYIITTLIFSFFIGKNLSAEINNNVDDSKYFIEQMLDTIYKELPNKNDTQEIFDYFVEFTENHFAFTYMSVWSLGSSLYNRLSQEEKDIYLSTTKDFMILLYGDLFNNYYKSYTYEIIGSNQKSDTIYEVSTKFTYNSSSEEANASELNVSWVIRYSKKDNSFYVIDVNINNITFLAAQRKQFNDILRSNNNDFQLFVEEIQAQNKESKTNLNIDF